MGSVELLRMCSLIIKRADSRVTAMATCAIVLMGVPFTVEAQASQSESPPLPPLSRFVAAARVHAVDNREASALMQQREAQHAQAIYTLLPAITASAGYTHNQLEIAATFPDGMGGTSQAVITAQDQLEASVGVEATLFDYAALRALGGASANVDAADAEVVATEERTTRSVIEAYLQRVGAEALYAAAEQAIGASESNRAVVAARLDAGLASQLDLDRANAALARNQQSLAEAELAVVRASRVLRTLSGLDAVGVAPPLDDALAVEAPLSGWVRDVGALPSVRAAKAQLRSAEASAAAEWGGLLPRVTASVRERYSNAPGFGPNTLWSAGVAATWRLGLGSVGAIRASNANAEVVRVRAERAVEVARDAIEDAWHEVRSRIARARATRSEYAFAQHAAEVARVRYASGNATQLEVLQADRDAFDAAVSRVRADADLVYSRAALRLAAGRTIASPDERADGAPR